MLWYFSFSASVMSLGGEHHFPIKIYIDVQSKCSAVLVAYLKCLWCCISFFRRNYLCAYVKYVWHYMSKNMRKLKPVIFRLLAVL